MSHTTPMAPLSKNRFFEYIRSMATPSRPPKGPPLVRSALSAPSAMSLTASGRAWMDFCTETLADQTCFAPNVLHFADLPTSDGGNRGGSVSTAVTRLSDRRALRRLLRAPKSSILGGSVIHAFLANHRQPAAMMDELSHIYRETQT